MRSEPTIVRYRAHRMDDCEPLARVAPVDCEPLARVAPVGCEPLARVAPVECELLARVALVECGDMRQWVRETVMSGASDFCRPEISANCRR
jgi:hypothetical protein